MIVAIGRWLCNHGVHRLVPAQVGRSGGLDEVVEELLRPLGCGPELKCLRCGSHYRRDLITGDLQYIPVHRRWGR